MITSLSILKPHVLTWKKSNELSVDFNRATKDTQSSPPIPEISFLPMSIFRIRDDSVSGGFRYLSAEPFMQGNFTKFNGNNGYIYNASSNQLTTHEAASSSDSNDVAQVFPLDVSVYTCLSRTCTCVRYPGRWFHIHGPHNMLNEQ
jgi:hypothetical protein